MTWISELTGHREWSFLKTLTEFTQFGTKRDPILNYSNILSERNAWYNAVSNLSRSCDRLESFIVDCKHSRPFVNEHYSYVQSIILYHTYVVVENLFRKKETLSRLRHSRAVSLFQNTTTFITKIYITVFNPIPSSSVGSTEILVKVYQKIPGSPNHVLQ